MLFDWCKELIALAKWMSYEARAPVTPSFSSGNQITSIGVSRGLALMLVGLGEFFPGFW